MPDGKLEFLGRKDFQVKIHGVRIELGEIEEGLRGIGGIEQAIVIAQPGPSGDAELFAYIITEDGLKIDHGLLRDQLAEELPPSMCPSSFIELEIFPLTPTGKIDRKAFPKPQHAEVAHGGGAEPETEVQRILVDIWTQLLGIDGIGIEDDFFDLGGNSLTAVRLCDEVQQRLGRSLSVVKVFECRAIRDLADAVESDHKDDGLGAQLVRLSQHDSRGGGHLYCICGIFLYEGLAKAIGESHSVSGVFLPVEQESLSAGSSLPSVEEMAAMYGEVVRRAQPHGPYRLAGLSFGGVLAYELARQLRAAGEEVDVLALFDAMLPDTVSTTKKLEAHTRLLLRQGPSYLLEKLKGRWGTGGGGRDPEFIDENLGEEDRSVAVARGRIYDIAASAYRSNMPCYDGDAIFFRALDCSEYRKLVDGPDCGWTRFIKGQLDKVGVPGGHVTMLQAPNVEAIGHKIRQALDDVTGR